MSHVVGGRVLHERIDATRLPSSLKARVEAHVGQGWSTALDGVAALRTWLLKAQKYRCAYCQILIPGVSVGLCELDHILPKNESAHCDATKAQANDYESRQHTLGYPAYTFLVCNLAVSCKQCNTSKKSFDPLANRSTPLTTFPALKKDYEWVHPHFDNYSQCITINEHWLYAWLNRKGEYTIRACKLDKSEVLARRHIAEALATQSEDLNHCLFQLIGRIDEIGHRDIANILHARFALSEELAGRLIALWSSAGRQVTELERLAHETCALVGEEMLARKPNSA